MCVSKPKVPTPTPVIERQAYKSAPSRASLGTDNNESRRRMIAGVATSAQGVTEAASTTKRVRTGGDQQLNPSLGGTGATPDLIVAAPVSVVPAPSPQSSSASRGAFSSNSAPVVAAARSRGRPYAGVSQL